VTICFSRRTLFRGIGWLVSWLVRYRPTFPFTPRSQNCVGRDIEEEEEEEEEEGKYYEENEKTKDGEEMGQKEEKRREEKIIEKMKEKVV